ncbi:MAG: glycosyl transferase [Lactobacillus sp.]|nr:glycosyl transferase [Lactobacillus sp.]
MAIPVETFYIEIYMDNKIPKVIHYCWFGGNPLPALAEKCIASWRKYFPDYEIKRWDESNFDINQIPYTAQAYEAKKFAFVSDYARFKILYEEGGLYFDTDVEVIKSMDDIIAAGPFIGCENQFQSIRENTTEDPGLGLGVNPGLGIGATPRLTLLKELLSMYDSISFRNPDNSLNTKTIVEYTTEYLCGQGLKNSPCIQNVSDFKIYPKEYFCPQDYKSGKIEITENTYSIHHYAESWHGGKEKLYKAVRSLLGDSVAQFISRIWKSLNK